MKLRRGTSKNKSLLMGRRCGWNLLHSFTFIFFYKDIFSHCFSHWIHFETLGMGWGEECIISIAGFLSCHNQREVFVSWFIFERRPKNIGDEKKILIEKWRKKREESHVCENRMKNRKVNTADSFPAKFYSNPKFD